MTRRVDPNKLTHVFATAATALGRDLVVYRETAEAIYSHGESGGAVLPAIGTAARARCLNCSDRGQLQFFFLTDPTHYMPRYAFQFHDARYWRYEVKSWACPACASEDRFAGLTVLLEMSGLLPSQYDLNPAAFAHDPDKADAISAGLTILGTLPRPSGFVTISGGYGVGKSSLARGIVAKACKAGTRALYVVADDILTEIKSTFRDSDQSNTAAAVVAKYTAVSVLAIDELFIGAESDWSAGQLRTLIDRRYQRRDSQATLILTNTPLESLSARDGYFASRAAEGVRAFMGGADLREGVSIPIALSGESL